MNFLRRHKNKILVIGVIIGLLITMGMTNKERDRLSFPERIVGDVISPVNKVSFNIRKKISDFVDIIRNLSTILAENESLKNEIAELKELNREQEDIIGKFDFLQNEQELEEKTDLKIIRAQITSKEPGNWYDRFMIDKGSLDGLKRDDTIIQAVKTSDGIIQEGIVGRVSDVGDNWAKVISIIDEDNNVSFKTLRTQDGGILSGSIDNQLEGFMYDKDADVIVGDKLYTSGLGGVFEKDMYIGEVEEVVEIEEELKKKVIVKPAIDFKKLYRVFIIVE